MSEHSGRPPSTSSVSSISLLEIKAETTLVLKAFLRQSLDLPLAERPGRVGGAYKEHSKFRDPGGQEHKDPSGSLEKDTRPKATNSVVADLRDHIEDDAFSPSSTQLFRRNTVKDSLEKPEPQKPQRPSKLSLSSGPQDPDPLTSPNHPPEFYEEVAERLELIAQKSNSIKRITSSSLPAKQKPPPLTPPTTVNPPQPGDYQTLLYHLVDKDEVVRQLIQVLSMEANAITAKIQSDPFLRSKLTRLSYPSFAKLLDAFSNSEVEQPRAPATAPLPPSPTLRRVAVTMEVSRRVVTATGTQRMEGYAERYMETFAPWVKSHGGWENIVQMEEFD
ncbi:hypothetical protein NHX12_031377 [Muraenolepis orangiensis]|uniref:Uncharacterized protein n=1 Tax=Muraenolepis orangiensis TaxID=630683 RepID=A0A9Q0E9H9_9TELE|nr:hypothetical protein NHX12_031377 [Muraenolepis orangiensis]